MRSTLGILFLVINALSATTAHAKASTPEIFEPITPWNVNYADDFCGLRRRFSNGSNTVDLELRQYAPELSYDLFLWGDWKQFGERHLRYRFSNDPALRGENKAFKLKMKDGLFGHLFIGRWGIENPENDVTESGGTTPGELHSWSAAVDSITIESYGKKRTMLKTGHLDNVLSAMSTCLDELITHWNIDPQAQKSLLRGVKPRNQQNLARKLQERYPVSALNQGQVGPVTTRIMVDKTGKPTECRAIASLTAEVLNNSACEGILKYGEFDPAIAANGEPIDSYWATKVIYRLN